MEIIKASDIPDLEVNELGLLKLPLSIRSELSIKCGDTFDIYICDENLSVKLDDLGRIYLPKKIREALHINTGDVLRISVSEKIILLGK